MKFRVTKTAVGAKQWVRIEPGDDRLKPFTSAMITLRHFGVNHWTFLHQLVDLIVLEHFEVLPEMNKSEMADKLEDTLDGIFQKMKFKEKKVFSTAVVGKQIVITEEQS